MYPHRVRKPVVSSTITASLCLLFGNIIMDQRLFDAGRTGHVVSLHVLLNEDPMILDKICLAEFPETPLHVAALAGKTEFAKEMIRLMPCFAMELNKDGFAPMHLASARGHVEMVTELLKHDNDHSLCFQKDKSGRIPLHHAVARGRILVIKLLISHHCESLKNLTTLGETVLHLAVKNSQYEALKVVLERLKDFERFGMLLTTKDNKGKGKTIVELAQATKQLQVLELLKEYQNASTDNETSTISPGNHETVEAVADEQVDQHKIDIPADPETDDQQQQESKEWKKKPSRFELHNLLLIAAVLIATVTYQAALTPPSNTSLDNVKLNVHSFRQLYFYRESFLRVKLRRDPFLLEKLIRDLFQPVRSKSLWTRRFLFMIINTAGFFSSVILILIVTLPYRYIPLQLLAISISLLTINYMTLLESDWTFAALSLPLLIIGFLFGFFLYREKTYREA